MKKSFFLILVFIFSLSLVFSQTQNSHVDDDNLIKKQNINLPKELCGLWEGKDRYIFIEENPLNPQEIQLVVVLKLFYGWYYDRAVEPEEVSNAYAKARNDGTAKKAQQIAMNISNISHNTHQNNSYEVTLNYSKYDKAVIPLAIYDDKIYLDFFVKDLEYDKENNPIITNNGVWKGNIVSEGLKISMQKEVENIACYIVDNNKFYDVRYWKTDMSFSNELAIFEYDDDNYYVPRHIFSANNNYTCVTGRRLKVRNPQKAFIFNENNYFFNEEKTLMIPKQEEYLVKVADKNTIEELVQIVNKANSRRKPPYPPLFEDKNLDWHWDIIIELQKYDPYVQKVRQRQKERGVTH